MEDENLLSKIKMLTSKYIFFIIGGLIIIVLIILLWPSKKETNSISSKLTLTLKGNTNVSIMKGEEYVEAGYYAYDTKEGDITNRVTIVGSVNTDIPGTYILKYSVINNSRKKSEAVRIINVIGDSKDLDVAIDYSPKSLTNGEVTITLRISGYGYDFAVNPDGNRSTSTLLNYKVSTNDEYAFSIKRKDGVVIEKSVTIKNIDKVKPTGSCKVTVGTKTDVTVTAKDSNGISKYVYIINNKEYESTKSTYSVNGSYKDVSVTIYDTASNSAKITCQTSSTVISNVGEWPEFVTPSYLPESTPKHLLENVVFNKRVRYLLYYPDNLDLSQKNPLVVYIHGAGDCGANTSKMYRENVKFVENMRKGKFKNAIYLAPQCNCQNGNLYICETDFINLINKIADDYNVNKNKISLTGISSGGSSAQRLISKNPTFFSGAALLAPGLTTGSSGTYKALKIAVFIGTKDALYSGGKSSAETLKKHGVDIKFYSIEGVGHVVEDSVYNNTNVIDWLIAQEKK